ncbi:hypothetical protein BDW75DRAFT_204951 [Aspergillus navahoensis]
MQRGQPSKQHNTRIDIDSARISCRHFSPHHQALSREDIEKGKRVISSVFSRIWAHLLFNSPITLLGGSIFGLFSGRILAR